MIDRVYVLITMKTVKKTKENSFIYRKIIIVVCKLEMSFESINESRMT